MVLKEFLQLQQHIKPEFDLRILEDWAGHVLGLSWSEVRLQGGLALSPQDLQHLEQGVKRLAQGEPLAYITGEKFFYQSTFEVGPGVLIPRPETERLVEMASEILAQRTGPLLGADIGTGTGCVGVSLALCHQDLHMDLIEACPLAMSWAKKNVDGLKASNCQLILSEVGVEDPYPDRDNFLDIILANPPYIAYGDERVSESVLKYEPHRALYSDERGLSWIHKWLLWSYNKLKPGGVYLFEFGRDQEAEILPLLKTIGDHDAVVIKDYSGHNRFMSIYKKG